MNNIHKIKEELNGFADKKHAKTSQRFFKTGKGEYGEGDVFIGVKVPNIRKVARKYKGIRLGVAEKFLRSKIHEERMLALLLLVYKFQDLSKHAGKTNRSDAKKTKERTGENLQTLFEKHKIYKQLGPGRCHGATHCWRLAVWSQRA